MSSVFTGWNLLVKIYLAWKIKLLAKTWQPESSNKILRKLIIHLMKEVVNTQEELCRLLTMMYLDRKAKINIIDN